ncbi:MAG: hypothetical protein Q9172_000515 [Xanthocarpia lactea]
MSNVPDLTRPWEQDGSKLALFNQAEHRADRTEEYINEAPEKNRDGNITEGRDEDTYKEADESTDGNTDQDADQDADDSTEEN